MTTQRQSLESVRHRRRGAGLEREFCNARKVCTLDLEQNLYTEWPCVQAAEVPEVGNYLAVLAGARLSADDTEGAVRVSRSRRSRSCHVS